MKVLNLYACLGGNRLKWTDCDVTAIELDPELARMYQERFPDDTVIITDAHQYLLDHYKEFDFIWSSPPCQTHSKMQLSQQTVRKMRYSDMSLYQEIIFLDAFFNGKYCVENVEPYYTPLIPATKIGRHLFWSNFVIPQFEAMDAIIRRFTRQELEQHHKIDLSGYKGKQSKIKIGRNLVHYDTGLRIFNLVRGIAESNNSSQMLMDI